MTTIVENKDLGNIAHHLDRIASSLERQEEFSKEMINKSLDHSMEDAMAALKSSNPVFAKAFEAVDKLLLGDTGKGNSNASGSG